MLVGAVLVNTSHSNTEIRQVLGKVERPLYFVLLIFAGAAWQPSSRGWLVPVAVLLLARTVAKLGAARFAARWTGVLPALGPTWGMGLLGHGGLAIAIALNYHLDEGSALSNVVFTAAIASVFLSDLFSARVVRSLVRAYGGRVRDAARRLAQPRTGQGAA
jgi:urea transporter